LRVTRARRRVTQYLKNQRESELICLRRRRRRRKPRSAYYSLFKDRVIGGRGLRGRARSGQARCVERGRTLSRVLRPVKPRTSEAFQVLRPPSRSARITPSSVTTKSMRTSHRSRGSASTTRSSKQTPTASASPRRRASKRS